jgi:hypothetical protein
MSLARLRLILRPRTLVQASALLVLAGALSGCIAIRSYNDTQRLQGYVTLQLTVCASDHDRDTYSTCDPANPSMNTAEGDNGLQADEEIDGSKPGLIKRGQLLAGFRVPNGAVAPTTFRSEDLSVSMTSSPDYTARLNTEFPPPAGFRWVGYISADLPFDAAFNNDRQTVLAPEFALPPGVDGAPFVGPFRWRAVIGLRKTGVGGVSPAASVTCSGSTIYVCFDSPQTVPTSHISATVADVGVHRGTTATVVPGETATVTFPIQNLAPAGTLGNRIVNLSASTTVPGASAAPAGNSINLIARTSATPTQTTTVSVPIPPSTPVGSYTATLTASANTATGPGLVRPNTATIQVVDRSAPAIRVSTPSDGATFVLGQSVPSDYGCTEEAGGTGLASCAGPVPSGEAVDTSSVGEKTFTVTSSDVGGNTASLSRTYTVVAPPPPTIVSASQPGRINFSLPFGFSAAASTRFNLLQVKNIPRGSLVEVRCKGRTCPKRTVRGRKRPVTFTKRNASGTVNIKPFRNTSLRAGTVLTVTVTKPGSFGMVKKVKIRRNRRPTITTTCLQPNSKASAPCA